ncbi:MAG TPA: nucleotide exchange factor GrpE [Nitrososphaera sp.]|nr:nucleotide exchange factor GrpE [Nitrososphaera sp.]
MEENEEVAIAETPDTEEGGARQDELRAELKSLREDLKRAKESSETNLGKVKYLMADFDNYRKQMERQVASKVESSKAELLLKFVNIRDDYVRALAVARQNNVDKVVVEGLEGILKNIDSLLASEGIIEIESVGTPFDPNVHDAIAFSQRSDIDENMITGEIRKGYMHKDKVLRPSMVEISRKPAEDNADKNSQ